MTLYIIISVCLFAGLVLSLILVQHYINEAGGFAEKWCSRMGGQKDKVDTCKSILDSRFAKTFGVSHADFGVMYFSGALLLMLTSKYIPWLVPVLGLTALVYSVFSIYVQKYVLRQWCILCLLIQASIIVQAAIIFSSAKMLSFSPSGFKQFAITIGIFLIPSVLWYFIRQFLVNRNALKSGQHSLLSARGLANFRKKKGKLEIEPLEGDIVYETPNLPKSTSKKDAPWRVVIGIAPSCEHCGEFLENMLALIEKDKLPIHLKIRFVIIGFDDTQESINEKTVIEAVMSLANSSKNGEGHFFAIQKLRSWYQEFNGKDLAGWLATFRPIEDFELNLAGAFMADNTFWMQEQDVEETPAVFIEEQRIEPQDSVYTPEVLRKLCVVK